MGGQLSTEMFSQGSLIFTLGVAIILHAAFAITEYRAGLKAQDLQFDGAPLNVILECCAGMMLCVFGTASSNAKLQPIFAKMECADRPLDKTLGSTSFINFNHRARSLAKLRVD